MAEDNGPITGTENDNLDALNALFLDGQSTERLDDAVEHEADGAEASNMEDVKGLANVQSSSRATFDDLNAGGAQEAAAAPAGADVVAGAYDPTETDNSVDAAFDNTPEQEIPSLSPASAGPQQDIPDLPRGEDELPEVVSDVRFPDGEGQDDPAQYLVDPVVEDDDPSPIPDDDDDDETVVNEAVLTVEDPSGIEGIPTKLEINAFADGSGDSLDRIEISGVPDYFEIVDSNGNPVGSLSGGTWVLTNPSPAQLDNLYLRNIAYDDDGDYSGTFDLTVTAYTEEDGIEKDIARDMTVYIEAVADAPGAEVTDAAGMENTWISLDIDVTDKDVRYENGVDVDTSETQTVYISDVPSGAQLNHGTVLTSDLTLEDGTVISAGSWVVDPADLNDLSVLPGPNSSKDFNLTVRVASTEESNGDVAVTGPLTIEVDVGLVDPSGSASGATTEDQLADLTMSASINQADGTEILTAYIEDLPDGAILVDSNGVQLTADAQGRYDVTAYRDPATNEINGLKVGWDQTTDAHSDEDISFNLRVVVTDGDTDTDTAAIQAIAPDTSDTVIPVTVEVAAVADAPTLSASAIGVEDQWFSLDIDSALVDTDGSETLSVSVTGNASDFSLRDADGTPYTGTDNGDGTVTYTFTPDQLETLQIKGAQDSDADFNLDIVATATEGATGDQVSQKTATTSTTVNVKVLSDADTPTIDVVSAPQTINEDTLFNLRTAIAGNEAVQGSLSEAGSADGDLKTADGSETLHFVLTAQDESVIVVNGVRTELSAGDSIELSAADVFNGNVLVGGRSDWASSSATDTLKFDLKTVATESNDAADDLLEGGLGAGNSRDGVAESESQTLTLVVNPVADSASIVASNAGFEDGLAGLNDNGGDDSGTAIALTPTITFTDTDGSEQPTGNFTITSDDPAMINGTITQDGVVIAPSGPDANGNYTWTFTNANFNEGSDNVWTLQGVTFMPADDASGTVNYDLSIEAFDSQASATRTVDLSDASVTLEAVADVPTVSLDDAQAMETASGALEIPLDISINNPDVDGSESQAVYITGIPASAGSLNVGTVITSDVTVDGVTISASVDNPVYLVNADDLSGLKLTINGEGNSEDLALNVYGVSTESSNGDQALSGPHALRVDIGVGTPTITVGTVAGNEDTHIALGNVRVEAFAPDATDTMTVYIEDIADGVSLYQQNDGGGYTELTPSTYTTPDGVTHTGYKIPADLIGANGELSGVFVKNDADGSDADINLTVRTVVQDVDADASLDAGGIDMNTAIGQPYADSAQTTQSVTVEVAAVADKAATSISGQGIEDQWFDLNLTATLQDTDGSEQITEITLTVPHDVLLQQADGTPYAHDVNSNGTWTYTIPKDSLGDVQAKAPQDSDANIKVIMKVTTTDTPTDGDPTPDTAVKTHSKWINIVSDADTPTLQVVDETQVISEDAFFNLNADIDPSTPGVQSAVSGALTEAGANAMDGESPDTSEALTFNIEAQQDSRIWIDADGDGVRDAGEVQTLTAGQSVEVTAEQIANNQVHVGGVENWASDDASDTLKFDITAVATEDREQGTSTVNGVERSGTAESDTQTLTLGVEAVADRTYVSAVASGVEDQVGGVPFNPVIRLEDTDGSESLTGTVDILIAQGSMDGHLELDGNPMSAMSTVTINGTTYDVYEVPVNTLEDRGNGRFQVDDVKYIPNEHSDKDFSYRIRTTTTDSSNGDSYTTVSSSGNLVMKAIVDAPVIEVNAGVAVVGDEDTVIPLNLSAQLQDQDGSETLTNAELQNVPDGWSVAYVNADGSLTYATQAEGSNTWVLDPSRIGDVALKPPLNADADASGIKFSVTSTEHAGQSGGDTQIVSGKASTTVETTFDVTLNAVADTPNLVVTDVRMQEDTTTQLDIRPALTDTDGSEVLSFTIADVPPGAQLVDQNGVAYTADNGVYTFTPDQANKIYYKPAANSNDDAALKVTAISTEQGDASSATASRTSTLNVTVTGVADAPHDPSTGQDLTDGSKISASGVEGQLIDPGLGAFHSLDVDGSEALSVVLSNIPDGVKVVLDGANTDQYVKYLGKNADGHDEWSVAPDYVDNVRFLAPDDYAGTFNVGVRLISTENDGDAAIVDTTLQVNVTPVTDAPRGWIGKSTSEDSWIDANGDDVGIPFSLNAQVTDTGNSGLEGDSGTETLSDIDVTVDVNALVAANGGSTAGIYVTFNGQQYNPVQNADGKYVIEINDIDVPDNTASTTLSGFKLFGVPEHSSTDVPISMKVTAQDGSDVAEASTIVNGEISITPVADAPLLSIDPPEGAGNPSGPSQVTITFEGESAGFHNTLGYYKIDPDTGRITDVKLIWENASSQGSGGNLDPGTTTETLDLQDGDTFGVFLIADGFDYNSYGSLPAGHFEFQNADGSLASLGSDQPKLVFVPDDNTIPPITINAPEGIYHTAGFGDKVSLNNDDRVHTEGLKAPENGELTLGFEDLPNLGDRDYNDSMFTINFGSADVDFENPHYVTDPDVYTFTDGSLTLSGDFGVQDTDGSETAYLVISGVPNGVSIEGGINNGNGSWTLPNGTSIDEIVLNSANTSAGQADLTVTMHVVDNDPDSSARDTASASVTIPVFYGDSTSGGGGATSFASADVSGSLSTLEDNSLGLSGLTITATGSDGTTSLPIGADGSTAEGAVSIVIDVPPGWTISGGVYAVDADTYTVPYGNLSSVRLTPPADYAGEDYDLNIRAMVTRNDGWYDPDDADMTAIDISVAAVTDGARLSASLDAAAVEDTAVGIDLTITAQDTDLSEVLETGEVTLTLSNVDGEQPGTLSGNGVVQNPDGSYTLQLSAAQIAEYQNSGTVSVDGLTFTPADNFSGSVRLTYSVDVKDGDAATKTSENGLTFNVAAEVDTTEITANNVTGQEDAIGGIPLDVTIKHEDLAVSDADWGSEAMSVVIEGVPAGATIEGAYNNGGGRWSVKDGNVVEDPAGSGTYVLQNVKYIPPLDDSTDAQLTVKTYSRESGSTEIEVGSASFGVTVTAQTDGATLDPQTAVGIEDQLVALNLNAQLLDQTETATVTVFGLPSGAQLTDVNGDTIGTVNSDGSVTLTMAEAGNVYFSGPAQVADTWELSAKITTTDLDTATDPAQNPGATVTSDAFTFTVTTTPDADAPTLSGGNTSGAEDTWISVDLTGLQTVDTDGSETLSIVISGAPEGTVFQTTDGTVVSATMVNGERVWVIPANEDNEFRVDGIQMKTPEDFNGTVDLTAKAVSTEGGSRADSAPVDVSLTVTAVNDAPDVDITSSTSLSSGTIQSPIFLLNSLSTASISDVDSSAVSQMVITIGDQQSGDSLGLDGVSPVMNADGNMVVTIDGAEFTVSYANGAMTISGSGTMDQYESVLSHVTFTSSTGTLGAGARTISVAVTDAEGATGTDSDAAAIQVDGTLTLTDAAQGDVYFSDNGTVHLADQSVGSDVSAAIPALTGVSLSGEATDMMSGMTVTLSGDLGAGDTLGLSGYDVTMNPDGTFDVVGTGLTVRYDGDTHTLTFSGDASVADYDALIDGLILTSTTDELAAGERTVSVTLTDDGNGTTGTQSVTTNITATQSLTGSEHGNIRFTADGGIALPDQTIATDMTSVITALPGVAIAGDAGAIMDGMVVELSGDLDLGDALGLNGYTVSMAADGQFMVDGTGLTVAYDAAARTLTFDGEATVSAYNALIGGVILTSQNGELGAGDRTVTVTMKDDAGADTQSQSVTTGIDVDQILDGAEAGSAVFGNDGGLILPGQEVSSPSGAIPALNGFNLSGDVDDTLSGMTVELSGELGADDSLALSGMDLTMNGSGQFTVEGTNVVVSYNAEHSALEFTGDASLADYESIANGIILSSSDGKMEPGARTVSVTTYDENGQASNPVSSTTTLTAEINLAGDDLGTVRWGADGSATVDDMIMVQYGSNINFVDGGENGTDSLYIQDADGVGNWLFTENDDGSILATSQTAGDNKSFVVNVEAGAAHIDEDGALLTFNPDTSGHVTFDDGSMMQFENLERLLGN